MAVRLQQAVLALFFGVLVCASLATHPSAQGSSSTGAIIDGTVADAQGVVPGATVILVDPGGNKKLTVSDRDGKFRFFDLAPGRYVVQVELSGYRTLQRNVEIDAAKHPVKLSLTLVPAGISESVVGVKADVAILQAATGERSDVVQSAQLESLPVVNRGFRDTVNLLPGAGQRSSGNLIGELGLPTNETYAHFAANGFKRTFDDPLSTFAADVDTASYTNVRRFLQSGHLPPVDAVRVEEMVNYFRFSYPQPAGRRPVSISAEIGPCPWNPDHRLALIGLRAKAIDDRATKRRNIVLLLDVSGSMEPRERLPLIKTAMRMFVDTLRDDDRIAIVVYAGDSGVALPPTRGSDRERIRDAIEALRAGGSTNGASGLVLAYQVARQQFVEGGINRVILATDGDFNVGVTSHADLLKLIEAERKTGVFLSVLGVGQGNLKDATMELLADKGNGQYHYLDSLQEARRALVTQGGALLETVAKDVKLQVEFNPAHVAAWKLLGYEKRLLAREDFNDDTKDGGELGAGHTVTVLYEIVPGGSLASDSDRNDDGRRLVDPLIYQTNPRPAVGASPDLFTVKVRYKLPDESESNLMTQPVRAGGEAPHLSLASAVAEFSLLLRDQDASEERWDALTRRVNTLPAGENPSDVNDFASLVAMAAAIERRGGR